MLVQFTDSVGMYRSAETPEADAWSMEHSLAISLKRIADALEGGLMLGEGPNRPSYALMSNIEHIAHKAGMAFQQGVREEQARA